MRRLTHPAVIATLPLHGTAFASGNEFELTRKISSGHNEFGSPNRFATRLHRHSTAHVPCPQNSRFTHESGFMAITGHRELSLDDYMSRLD